jgi:hypothetical protein
LTFIAECDIIPSTIKISGGMIMPREKKETVFAGLRVSPVCKQLWVDTAKRLGISRTAALEIAMRKFAEAEGIAERPLAAKEHKAPKEGKVKDGEKKAATAAK